MNKGSNFYVNKIEEINICDNQIIIFSGNTYELPFSVKPIEEGHRLDICEGCQKDHSELIEIIKRNSEKFPLCCKEHSRLLDLPEFKKEDFIGLEKDIADKIMFTHHHIINNIDKDEWYVEITSYIEYILESLGSFPPDHGAPFMLNNYYHYFKHYMDKFRGMITRDTDNLSKKEFDIRLNEIDDFFYSRLTNSDPSKNSTSTTDFNLLLAIYNKWYKTFPFELSYFQHLKEKFQKSVPVMNGCRAYNKYTGKTTAQLHTKESLTNLLIEITEEIISNINGLKLYEKGLLSNSEQIKLELILQNRKLEISEISMSRKDDRKSYIRILKKWFKSEKKFIKEIEPFLNKKTENLNGSNTRPNRTDIAYCIHYLKETKTLQLENPFPSDKAWKEIEEIYKKNSKNIQKVYNVICSDQEERLKKTKKVNLSFVIENMLKENKKALELAKDELNLLELNS